MIDYNIETNLKVTEMDTGEFSIWFSAETWPQFIITLLLLYNSVKPVSVGR